MDQINSRINDLIEIAESNISYGIGDEEYNMGMIDAYREVQRIIPSKTKLHICDEIPLNIDGKCITGSVQSIVKYRNNVYTLSSFNDNGVLRTDWFIYNKIINNSWSFAPRVFLDKLDDEIGYDVIELDSE